MKIQGSVDLPGKMLAGVNRWEGFRARTRVWGFLVTPPTLDRRLALLAHRWGLLGQDERLLLERCLSPRSVSIDVGANLGLYSLLAARLSPQGSVFALEPDPDLHLCMEQNAVANGLKNIQAIRCAASDRPGRLRFAPGRFNRGDNRIQGYAWNPGLPGLEVPASRLDDLIPATEIDLLKIDVQGWELPVLRGAKRILSENPALVVLVEFWPFGLRAAGFEPAQLLSLLQRYGFHIRRLGKKGRAEAFTGAALKWGNANQYGNLIACRDPRRIDP
jgi:FkbM family methyltransferase